jgi:hypothetical protein
VWRRDAPVAQRKELNKMKKESRAPEWQRRFLAVGLALAAVAPLTAQDRPDAKPESITETPAYHHDVSPPLRDIPEVPVMLKPLHVMIEPGGLPFKAWKQTDPVVQDFLAPEVMPAPILNFDGVPFPGVACNCAPPDTNGEVGATQYLQIVNQGFQVFNKTTGASQLGPLDIQTVWSGFGGLCETSGFGDPVALYDQMANRWLISQFAGSSVPTDECVAISQTSDATGAWFRYAFHLGSNFFDYPKFGAWPDGYYMSMNVFNTSGTAFLGPQPFVFDRASMLTGAAATFITPGLQSTALGSLIPGDLDGPLAPPAGAPNPWMSTELPTWKLYRFHVDWGTPANSTFTLGGNLTPAGYSTFGGSVPQLGGEGLDSLADRPMFRLAYRRFADNHEALTANLTVASGGVAGVRWFEINHATSGTPAFTQQGTYQPDSTYRWMGSVAMDGAGNLAVGFSASSASIHPEIRYAGRLAGDPAGTLGQGEATLFAGSGSQVSTSGRWGDYSDLTVDPVDDCTFWYTTEYYQTTSSFNWRTRIGNFKFDACGTADFTLGASPASQSVCAGTNAVYTVNVGSVSGFSNNVTLAAAGNPGGTTTSFVPNPVTPPGASTFTVGNTAGASAGTSTITIAGSASGSGGHSVDVDLTIVVGNPSAPVLVSPMNGTNTTTSTPTFQWNAAAGADSYLLEVDDSPDFSSPVYSNTVSGTSDTPPSPLPAGVPLYWRVTADNACGGTVSQVFHFAVGGQVQLCNNPNLAIPDNVPAGVTDTMTIPSGPTIPDLNITLNVTHTFVGDLRFTLSHNGGAAVDFFDRPGYTGTGFGCGGDNVDVMADDQGPDTPIENQCSNLPAISGDAVGGDPPNSSLLAAFNGQSLAGTWVINASDNAGADTGTLNQWCLVVPDTMPFLDGFETDDTSRWSATVP